MALLRSFIAAGITMVFVSYFSVQANLGGTLTFIAIWLAGGGVFVLGMKALSKKKKEG